jgi:hypothetical protein
MAMRPFNADKQAGGQGNGARPVGPAHAHRYRLTVVATDIADAVHSAGGWLCDRARAGWDVTVLVADHQNTRPVAILGATAVDIDAPGSSVLSLAAQSAELAVTARALTLDERVRADVRALLKKGCTAVTVWGDRWPSEVGGAVDPTEHRLSAAARAFKAHALEAATPEPQVVTASETCFDLAAGGFRPLYPV